MMTSRTHGECNTRMRVQCVQTPGVLPAAPSAFGTALRKCRRAPYNVRMISQRIASLLEDPPAGAIRKMFEDGIALKERFGADAVYDFSLGNPAMEPPPEVTAALKTVAADLTQGVHGYMPNAGFPAARTALAEKTSREQGVSVPMQNVVLSVGAAGALNVVLKSLLNPQDEVIVLCPYFSEYDHYILNHGGTVVRVQTRADFTLDVAAITRALTARTQAIIINSPNNPTGRIYTADEIGSLAAALRQHGNVAGRLPYLIADEPYRAIVYGKKTVPAIFPVYENSIVVTSFAKSLSIPGERIGYIAVNPACAEAQELVAAAVFATRTLGYVNAPALFQRVITAAWDAPCDYSGYALRLEKMVAVLTACGLEYAVPDGAFYVFVKVPAAWGTDDVAFTEHLKRYRILCVPGSCFGRAGWFRVAYCCTPESIDGSREAFCAAVREK